MQDKDKCFTAFEANRRLYQFRGIPFGVRNRAAAFQKITYDFRTNESLSDTFAYFDDITICVHDQAYHDNNLENLWLLQKKKIGPTTKTNVSSQQERSTLLIVSCQKAGFDLIQIALNLYTATSATDGFKEFEASS